MRVGKLTRDTAVLTAAALLMRLIGLVYQSWLARRIGAAGLGLWQLVQSVNVLSATLAISGIRFTATRLVSEELSAPEGGSAGGAVLRCALYALMFGCGACLLTFFCAAPIGFLWIGDARAVNCLRIFSFALPMISLSCVLNGYFVASGQAAKCALIQIFEQCVNVCAVMLLLRRQAEGDLAGCCAALARGNLIADACSLLLSAALYAARPAAARSAGTPLTGRMLRIALPLAVSAYARTGLSTLEHMLVPRKLRQSGLSAEGALSGYGVVTGMVFPLLAFPACLLTSLAELTVPELTAAQVRGDSAEIRRTVKALLSLTAAYALAVTLLLLLCADALGTLVYHSVEAGRWIRLLAPLVPIMYLDIVTDGCLKGLGQMLRSMCFNVSEALLGLLLVVTLLPRFALNGYLALLYCSELWNFALSFHRLRQVAGLRLLRNKKRIAGRPSG